MCDCFRQQHGFNVPPKWDVNFAFEHLPKVLFVFFIFFFSFFLPHYQNPFWHVFLRGNASVHLKGSLKFWVTQSSFRADANFNGEEEEEEDQRLHFFAFNPKKWWGNKTKGWMPCHNSLQKSISKQKKKKIIIPYMTSMQGFLLI